MTEKYHDKYCKIHDQWYGDHLSQCPICVGETMGKTQEQLEIKFDRPKLAGRPKLAKRKIS